MANHTYYYDMLKNTSNVYIILATLVCSAIPVSYMLYRKWANIKWLSRTLWIWLLLYGILYASIRENILGTGAVMRAVNSGIMFIATLFIIVVCMTLWMCIYRRLYGEKEQNWRSVLLTFWLGFSFFTIINYFLILSNTYYPLVNRLQVAALVFLMWKEKNNLKKISDFINKQVSWLLVTKNYSNFQRIVALLFLISVAYYFIGFKLAYIPYPTARDANHAYMLMPNSISWNNWRAFNGPQWVGYFPIYLSFISFFFSLIKGLGTGFWISPDTFWVEMNYLTALFTFFCTLGIIDKVLDLVSHKDTNHKLFSMSLGWFSKLLWLSSGMGAFLVFVDNKSDFGIMFLSCLWLFSGLWYIDYLIKKYNQDKDDDISKKEWLNDLLLSGFFFALAVASKVTALFDAMNFILLIIWFTLWWVVLLWLALIITWALAYLGLNGVSNFISKPFANIVGFGWGSLISLVGLAKWQKKYLLSYRSRLVYIIKHIALRWLVFILSLIILKLPITLFRFYRGDVQIQNIPKEIILSYDQKRTNNCKTDSSKWVLLASNNVSQLNLSQCSAEAVWITDSKDLYKELLTPPGDGYSEDVGRYIWFGQKEFNNPWRWFLVPNNSCISINRWASILCQNKNLISSFSKENLTTLLSKLKKDTDSYTLVNSLLTGLDNPNILSTYNADSQKILNDYRQDKVIHKEWSKVSIPYKTLVPLNVTFNRSLQNLSSYYTDIGIIRLMLQFFIIVGFIYWLCSKNRLIWSVNLVAVIGWLLWIAIWWGIVRYGIWLITRTIMWFVLFVHDLYIPDEEKNTHEINHFLFYLFIGLFLIFWLIQLSLNFIRIASQWGSWPFLQYKYSNGQELQIDENLQQKVAVKFPYKRTDILNLQFPHYNKVLQAINNQTGNEVNLIAWTYAQYRVNDPTRLYGDGLLSNLRTDFSDRNLCKSYLRLKDKDFKYMIIDPNIASIVMWWWNSSLMERFFAKMDPSGKIVTDGTLSMLGKLVNAGYLSIYSTNNLGAKYGFWLESDYLKSKLWIANDDDLAMMRARFATVRFRGNQQQMIDVLSQIFTERVTNGKALGDIADVYGKVIDEAKLTNLVNKASTSGFPSIQPSIKELSQDERFVLLNYLNILTTYNKQPAQFGSIATNIINQSLWGGSQLIVFEVK